MTDTTEMPESIYLYCPYPDNPKLKSLVWTYDKDRGVQEYLRKDVSDKRITELERQNTDLQESNTKLKLENRELKPTNSQLNELIDSQLQTINALKLRLQGLTKTPPSAADYEATDD